MGEGKKSGIHSNNDHRLTVLRNRQVRVTVRTLQRKQRTN